MFFADQNCLEGRTDQQGEPPVEILRPAREGYSGSLDASLT